MSVTSRALRELTMERTLSHRQAIADALDDVLLLAEREDGPDRDGMVSIDDIYEVVANRLVTYDMRSDFIEDEEGDIAVNVGSGDEAPRA